MGRREDEGDCGDRGPSFYGLSTQITGLARPLSDLPFFCQTSNQGCPWPIDQYISEPHGLKFKESDIALHTSFSFKEAAL